ncbi:MAG: hypothetical protein F4164_09995, partial [Gemmatimonadales bacterium]|nr:hypothetical protein [Gemmatimonadales bacterium]
GGVGVYGDARAAAVADFDADGRWDLAVGQNGAETVIFRGRGGAPGLRVRLSAGAAGARLRPTYADGSEGPAREIQLGSGYWSFNGSVQVLGRAADIRSLTVRWPDGVEETFPVEAGAVEVTLRRSEGS